MVVKKKVDKVVKKPVAKKTVAASVKSTPAKVPAAPAPSPAKKPVIKTAPSPAKPESSEEKVIPQDKAPASEETPAKKTVIKPNPAVITRVASGVPGLDKVIEGGFEKNSAVLISGGGGSGKTIMGLQFLLEGIEKHDETGVYISFEENKEKFYRHMLRFGWDLAALEKRGRFVFIKYSPEKMADMVEMGGKTIGKELREINGKRIVIDSLSAYTVLFEKESDQRKMLVSLFTMIEGWDATTIVIAEENPDINKFHSSVMGFMADAIIYLYNIIHENTLVRAMHVAKMRGTNHTQRIFPLMIEDSGISAYPEQDIFEHDFGKDK